MYNFQVDLANKRIELILSEDVFTGVNTIISMNLVPDLIQIQLYKTLGKLLHDYQSASQHRNQ